MLKYKTEQQNFSAQGQAAGELVSQTFFEATLSCFGAPETTISLPVQVCTTCGELRKALADHLGYIEPSVLVFIIKQGCSYKVLSDKERVARKIVVKGIKNFEVEQHTYSHPHAIIGAGYNGIKTAMFLEQANNSNYIVFDRYDRVGGHCWLEMANKTTKLQTEFPTYHVWYGKEFSSPGIWQCGGPPTKHEIWPSCDQLLEHFQRCAEDWGILANIRFGTEVVSTDVVGKVTDRDRFYTMSCQPTFVARKLEQGGGPLPHQKDGQAHQKKGRENTDSEYLVSVSTIATWPGNLVFPRPVVYTGEDLFGGPCDYAVEMRFDYSCVTGKVVTIHGHGAFTMENIRTCLEWGVKHIYLLCRKRNLTCPRLLSWFINQAHPPVSAAQCLHMLKVAYQHCDYDPWEMHSVTSNQTRTHCTVVQKTRFGIGDVYFLACAYGLMEIVVGNVKRCSHHAIHLESGRKLETEVILKCTGCLGDWRVDKFMKLKEMKGYWVNGDVRRSVISDPDGISASNFGGTSVGPGSYGWVKTLKHFWDVPNDWLRMEEEGIVALLPVHKAGEPNEEVPCYMISATHSQGTGILLDGACILLQRKTAEDSKYKHFIQHLCAPLDRVHAEAKADWEQYERKFREKGMVPPDTPYVPYLYDVPFMERELEVARQEAAKKTAEQQKKDAA